MRRGDLRLLDKSVRLLFAAGPTDMSLGDCMNKIIMIVNPAHFSVSICGGHALSPATCDALTSWQANKVQTQGSSISDQAITWHGPNVSHSNGDCTDSIMIIIVSTQRRGGLVREARHEMCLIIYSCILFGQLFPPRGV